MKGASKTRRDSMKGEGKGSLEQGEGRKKRSKKDCSGKETENVVV